MDENDKRVSLPNKNIKRYRGSTHDLRKRQPKKEERAENIIYVSTKTPLKALIKKCLQLIEKFENEIVVYCLGLAIQRGILLALKVCEDNKSYLYKVYTLTSELTDDLVPAADDADYEIQRRYNSALKIILFKRDLVVNEQD